MQQLSTNGSNDYESILLGAYSEDGHRGMMASSFTAHKKAVSVMLGKVGGKTVSMSYPLGNSM